MFEKLLSPFMLAYIGLVVLVNIGFSYVPMVDLGWGLFSPMAILVGLIFVIRDFAQRHSGHYVLFGMAVATVLSFVMADPFVAVASATAFGLSELADWAIYTVTKKPFHQRVLLSSVISTPVDTAVFLFMISGFTAGTFVLMILSKMVAAALIYWRVNRDPDWRARYGY